MTTNELLAIVQKKYGPPEYCFLCEVRNGTGFTRQPRTADALAFNLWPSRGMELLGFELKVSRGDWKKELSDPAKAEAIALYCDRWWVVVGDEKIVLDNELPPTWGLQVATAKGLKVIREAPKNESPKPLDRHFIWACLRQYGAVPQAAIEEARRDGYNEGYKRGEEKHLVDIERARRDHQDLARRVNEFEKGSVLI